MSEKTVNVDLDLEKAWKSIAEDHFKNYQDNWLLMNKNKIYRNKRWFCILAQYCSLKTLINWIRFKQINSKGMFAEIVLAI